MTITFFNYKCYLKQCYQLVFTNCTAYVDFLYVPSKPYLYWLPTYVATIYILFKKRIILEL